MTQDAGALLKLADKIDEILGEGLMPVLTVGEFRDASAALRQAVSQSSAGGERAFVIEECAMHLEHEADIATNSLHCGDNYATIVATYRVSRAYHEAAKSLRALSTPVKTDGEVRSAVQTTTITGVLMNKAAIVQILRSRVRTYSPAEDIAPSVTNADEVADLILALGAAQAPSQWQPIATEPNDGNYRLYRLTVNHRDGTSWGEVHYLAWEDGGDMIDASGDKFSDWSHSDFEHWAEAPSMPSAECK
jgi:hypothetical protein